jgi:hypothetical protein
VRPLLASLKEKGNATMFRSVQEQEQFDYEMGMATELQNAYAYSRMTTTIKNETKAINELSAAGWYVAVGQFEICCQHTDALIGTEISIIGKALTFERALAMCGGEESYDAHVVFPERC